MAGACGVSSPGLSPPGAGKDLGCSVPGSVSCWLLLPFLASTGPALPGEHAWLDTLILCRELILGSLPPPPPPPILCLCVASASRSLGSISSSTEVLGQTLANISRVWIHHGGWLGCACPGHPQAVNVTSGATSTQGGLCDWCFCGILGVRGAHCLQEHTDALPVPSWSSSHGPWMVAPALWSRLGKMEGPIKVPERV